MSLMTSFNFSYIIASISIRQEQFCALIIDEEFGDKNEVVRGCVKTLSAEKQEFKLLKEAFTLKEKKRKAIKI